MLVDAAPAVLGGFGDKLARKASEHLRSMGVELQLDAKVVGMDATGVEIEDAAGHRRIPSLCRSGPPA